jgi:hypothetical protein
MPPETNGEATPQKNVEELALEFLQGTREVPTEEITPEFVAEQTEAPAQVASDHPAWNAILDAVPAEYHDALKPTLQEWDTGVSRRFQKLHDEYEPLKALADYDPDTVREAVNIYTQLVNDPAATWETIGRVFELSPQDTAQSGSSIEEDFEDLDLPDALIARLARIDDQDKQLQLITEELNRRRAEEEEAEGEAELDAYLVELEEEYGEFDADYVIGLLSVGIDGEEAISRWQAIRGNGQPVQQQVAAPAPTSAASSAPKVMSSAGGVPTSTSSLPDLTNLSNQNTQALVEQILRQAQQE